MDLLSNYWHLFVVFYRDHKNFIDLCLMPVTYGLVGWITNWQAVKMIFAPMKFWGIPPYLGWQGIVPRKAHIFAGRTADYLESKLVHLPEIFDKLDPRVMAQLYEERVDELTEDIVLEIAEKTNPVVWRVFPAALRHEIINASRNQAPKAWRLVISDLQKHIEEVFDVKQLSVESMSGENVPRLVHLVKTVGKKEFSFIVVSGFYFGFLLGLFQVVIWQFFPVLWLLPVQGVIVGYITNWLAVNMIFRPLEPKRYFFFFKWQGMFIRRKKEVSAEFSKLVATDVLTAKNIIRKILMGTARDRIHLIIRMAVSQAMDRMTVMIKPLISSLSSDTLDQIKHELTMELTSPEVTQCLEDYINETLDVEQIMVDKFDALTGEEFEQLLRPIFKEDEWVLIMVGAILGGAVGFLQYFIMLL